MKRIILPVVLLITMLSGCRKAMSPEQLMQEAASNLYKSDRLHLHAELSLNVLDGSERESETLAVANLYAEDLQSSGRMRGDIRLTESGDVQDIEYYADEDWLYVRMGSDGVCIPISDMGMENILAGTGLPYESELLSEPEIQVEEKRTVLIYRIHDSTLNSVAEKIVGITAGKLFSDGKPVLRDGEMQIFITEGEIQKIGISMLTVGTGSSQIEMTVDFLTPDENAEILPPEGYETYPRMTIKETVGAGS